MNQFDKGMGYYSGVGGLNGGLKKLLKKVEKGVRTGVKSVTSKITKKIASPIAHAILPKAIRKVGKDLDRKGINKIAAAVVASVFMPAAGAAMMSKIAVGGAKLAVAASAKSGAKKYATSKVKDAALKQAGQNAAAIGAAVKQLPEFQGVVTQLRNEGYTDADIAKHWAESKSFYETGLTTVKGTIAPTVAAEVNRLNIPPEIKEQVVETVSNQIADNAVTEVKQKVTGNTPLLALMAVVAAALVGGA
jgi:hypothetical protein